MNAPRSPEKVYTRPLADKLGIVPGSRVSVVGVPDAELRAMLRERGTDFSDRELLPEADMVFLAADAAADLERLAPVRRTLVPNGSIWVVSRKGKAATLRDVEVIAAALANGLVDNKVVAFSATHTALRLVIPRALRAAHSHAKAAEAAR